MVLKSERRLGRKGETVRHITSLRFTVSLYPDAERSSGCCCAKSEASVGQRDSILTILALVKGGKNSSVWLPVMAHGSRLVWGGCVKLSKIDAILIVFTSCLHASPPLIHSN